MCRYASQRSLLINIKLKYTVQVRASDISRKKTQNFAGFSGANSRKNRPISRDFRGKKVKIHSRIGRFRGRKVKIRRKSADFAGFQWKKVKFRRIFGANS